LSGEVGMGLGRPNCNCFLAIHFAGETLVERMSHAA
jgi:hypothetical protein